MLKADIDRDLKTAMLARDKRLVSILRSLKSALLYQELADGKRESGLDEAGILAVLKKERKTRRDSSEIYRRVNDQERADEEDYQIKVIEQYLPEEMSQEEAAKLVDLVVGELGIDTLELKDIGRIIGAVKQHNPSVDGAVLSIIIKNRIGEG